MRRAKKRKNLSSARHYDQIKFRFRTAKTLNRHKREDFVAVHRRPLRAIHVTARVHHRARWSGYIAAGGERAAAGEVADHWVLQCRLGCGLGALGRRARAAGCLCD